MIIRKAKSIDANDLKVLYFEYLTMGKMFRPYKWR